MMSQQSPCPAPHKDPQSCGVQMTAHRRHFRCFDAQLEDQSQCCIPHSPDYVTSCLCSTSWLGHAPRRPAWMEDALAARPQLRRQRKRVVLVRNSDPTVRRNIILNPRALRSLRLFLEEVSELLHFRVHKLYTLDGRKIDSTHTLLQCPSVLVCVGREPVHPPLLQTLRRKAEERLPPVSPAPRCVTSARGLEAARDANLGPETKQSIIHPRSDSTTRTRRNSPSSEKSFPNRLNSTSLGNSGFPGACQQIKHSLSGDDIEKRVIVHENGSLSMEMKVRFHLLNNEVLHWSTEVKKSAGTKTDTGCNCCQINSESCSETESISAYEAQDADMTRLFQRHLEDPHCQYCCAQCLEYEIWKSQKRLNLQTVRHIRSSGSSASSHTVLCKKSSVDSMSTMSLSSEEYVEQMVEKVEKGDATVEYCTISHCYSHSEVCSVTTASKSTGEEYEDTTNIQTCGTTQPVGAGSVHSRGSQIDQLSVTITQVSDEDDRPISAISNSSQVLQMLKEDQDNDSDLPPSISQASSYSHQDYSEDDTVKSASSVVCKYASPLHHLTLRPHNKTPASSGHSTRSTKSHQAALTNQVVNSFEKCENGTKESETRACSVVSPNSNTSANSKKSDKSNCRSCGGVITPHSVISHCHGQTKDEKVETISLVSLATADDEREQRVTRAPSTQSVRLQTSTRSMNSEAPEKAEHKVGLKEEAENRSQSTLSNKSHISRKSVNSEVSKKVEQENRGEETTQERVPVQPNPSAGHQESPRSESGKHQSEKESEKEEHRTASSLSANSNVSIRSKKSKGSDKAEDDIDREEQVRDGAASTLSVISNTSTRSRKSKMSEKWQEKSGKEKGNITDISELGRETRSLSAQSTKSGISPGPTSSRVSDKAHELKEEAEEIGTRAPSTMSCKSCASTRSRTSKMSVKAAHAIEREGKDGARAQSSRSIKSPGSMRSRESQASTKADDTSRGEEPSQDRVLSACSVKSHLSVRASELQASVISPEDNGEGEDCAAAGSREEEGVHPRPISALSSKSNASEKSVTSEWSEAVIELNTDEEETQTRAPSNFSGKSYSSTRSRKSEMSERGKEHGEGQRDITNDFGEEKQENRSLSALSIKPDFLVGPSKSTISEKDPELNAAEEKQEEGTKSPRSLSVTSHISSASGKSQICGKVDDQNGGEEPSQDRALSTLSVRSCNSARSSGSKVPEKPEVAKAGKEEAENRTPSVLSSQTNASERAKNSSTLHCRSCGRPDTPHSIPNSGTHAIEGAAQEVYPPVEDRDDVDEPAADTEEKQFRDQTTSSISSDISARNMKSTTVENLCDLNREGKREGHEDTVSTASNSTSKSSVPQKMSLKIRDENGTSEDVDSENRAMSGASNSFAGLCMAAAVEREDRESSSASISQECHECEGVCSAESALCDTCIEPDIRNLAQGITASENQPKDASTDTTETVKERAGSVLSTKSKKSNQTPRERGFTPTTTLVSTGLMDEQESATINETRGSAVSVSSQASAQSNNSASIGSSHHKKCPSLSVGSKMADNNEILHSDEKSDDRLKSAASTRMETSEQNERSKKGSHLNAENDRASSSMSKSSRGSIRKSRDLRPSSNASRVSLPSEKAEATKNSSNETLQKVPSRGVSSASVKSSASKSKLIDKVSTVMEDSNKMSNHSPTLQVTERDIKSVDKIENSSICSVKSSNSNKNGSPTISVISPNKLGPCTSKGSPKKTETSKFVSETSNDGIGSQTDFQLERTGNTRPATSQSKSHLSDCTSSDAMDFDCIKNMTCSKSSRSNRCGHRKYTSPSQKTEVEEDKSGLTPSSLPNASPTEVVNEWLKKIPSDGSMYELRDELNENSDVIKVKNQMESAVEPILQELERGTGESSEATEEQICAAERQGNTAEVLIGEENNDPCHEEQTTAEITKTDLPNPNLSAETLPTTFHSSVQLMRALLCPKLYRCNSLPEVSHFHGEKLSNSAKELLDCLTSLQLIDSGSLGVNAKDAKYEEVMSFLQSLWLTCQSDGEYQKIQKKNLRKEQSGEEGFTPRSSSGVDVSSGSAGSGNGSISLIHKMQTAAEGRAKDHEDLFKLSEETEGNEGVENCAVFSPQSGTDEETHVSDPATSVIASQVQLTPQRAEMLLAEEKLKGEEGPTSSKTMASNESPSSSITSSANGSKALKLLVETQTDPPEDTGSGTRQSIDPVWVLNLLNKIENKFMSHYMNAMTEFKSRWNLEDNEQLDTMINELRDEVHMRIKSSIDREMKKIHAGKIPRPPEKSSSQGSSVQSVRWRRQLKTMLFRSNDAQKSDVSTVSGPDFSEPQSEEEYCPCESCMKKKTTLQTAAHLEPMSSAPVVMDFDLKKVLNLRKDIVDNIQEEECGVEERHQSVPAENEASQAGKWSCEEDHRDGREQGEREKEEAFAVKMEATAGGSQEDADRSDDFHGHIQKNEENVVVNVAETITESLIDVNGTEVMNKMEKEDNETMDKVSEEAEKAGGDIAEAEEAETAEGDTAEVEGSETAAAEEGETAEGVTSEAEEGETAEGDTADAEEAETAEGVTAEAEGSETAEVEEGETAEGVTAEAKEGETAEGDTAEAEGGETAEGDTAEAEKAETAEGDTAEDEAEGETAGGDTAEAEEGETAARDTAQAVECETAEGDTAETEEGETAEGDTAEVEGSETAEAEEGETVEGVTAEADEGETAEGDTAEGEEGETAERDTAEAEGSETAEGDVADAEEGETAKKDPAEAEEGKSSEVDTAEAEEGETAERDRAEAEEGGTAERDTAEAEEGETAEQDTAEAEEGETAKGDTDEAEAGETAEAEENETAKQDTAEAEEGETAEREIAEGKEDETAEGDTAEAEENETAERDTAAAEEGENAEGDTAEVEEVEKAEGVSAEAEDGETAEGDTAEPKGSETAEGDTAEAEDGEIAESDTAEAEEAETAKRVIAGAEEGEIAEGDTAEAEGSETAEAEEGETAEGVTAEAEEGKTAEGDTGEAEEGETAEGVTAEAEVGETAEQDTAEAEEGETAEGDTSEAKGSETAEGDTAEAEEGEIAEGDTAEAERSETAEADEGEAAEGDTAGTDEGETAEGDTAEADDGETAEGDTAEAEEGETAEGDTAEADAGETAERDTAEAEEGETAKKDPAEAEEGKTSEGDTAEAEEGETAEGVTAEAEEGETADGVTAEAHKGETAGVIAEADEGETAEGVTAEADEGETAEGNTAEAEEGETAEGDTAEADEGETAEGVTAEADEGETAEEVTAEAEEGETAEGVTAEADEGETAEGVTAEADKGETAEGDTAEAEEGEAAEGDTAEAEESETAEGDTAEADEGETAEGVTAEAEEGETAEGDTAEAEEGETAEGDTAEADEGEAAEGVTAEADKGETAEGDTAEAEEGEAAEGDTAEAEESETAEGDTAEADEGETAEGVTAEAEEGKTAEGDTAEADEGETAEGVTAEADEGETAEGVTAEADEGETAAGDTAEAEEDETAEVKEAETAEDETAEAEEDEIGKALTAERAEAAPAVETKRDDHERCDLQQGGERKLEKNIKVVTGEDLITEAERQESALRVSREVSAEDGSVEEEHQMSAVNPRSPAASPSASPGVSIAWQSTLGNSRSAGLQAQQMYPISSEESGDTKQNEPALCEKSPEKKHQPNETDIDQDDFDF